ncbi:MAG: glycoside hydrolase family 2 protein [Rhodoglobus sp.]
MTNDSAIVREHTREPLSRTLHEGWSLRALAGTIPAEIADARVAATVPGSVHTDLLAAGLIPDPYLDDNERILAWIGGADWQYSTTFEWTDDGRERTDLVFQGLDTVASIELNGSAVGSTVNMHRTYRFDVSGLLREGQNELVVTFSSPVKYADRMSLEIGYRPHVNFHPYNAIRKMACNFGWDWGLDAATAGIWRPVVLHGWSTARLAAVRPLASVDGTHGLVTVHVELERAADVDLTVSATVGDSRAEASVAAGSSSATLELSVADVDLWWPLGYGEQPLYPLAVDLSDDDGVIDQFATRLGFRTVRLDREPDEFGTSFVFVVNGQPLFIKGANWIPDDAFVHRVTRDRYRARIDQAVGANINLLRVWGGGIFESDDFYELCDERGVLVWQDFLFACAAYSEEEPMRTEVLAEVRDNVIRLLPHPSLVLWNGCNENIWGYSDWGWEKRLEGQTWGLGYYLELLPELLAQLDPNRPYTPASPWSPGPQHADGGLHPNDNDNGSSHQWELWNRLDYPHYRDLVPRFVGEFGWQGPPTWSTMTRSISDDPLTAESPGMIGHQKALGGNDKLTDGLVAHLPFQNDTNDWHWAMSLNQAVAVRTNIEHLRSYSPRCAGSVVWQLNDCWPVTSWAAIDGDGRAKPTMYAIRHAYASRLVTVQPRGVGLAVVVVNDEADAWTGELTIERRAYTGAILASTTTGVHAEPRQTVTVTLDPDVVVPADPASEYIVASIGSVRGLWFFAEYRDSGLAEPRLVTSVVATATGYTVMVRAENLVRDVALLVDKLDPDAVADDMLVTLLPGESAEFAVATSAGLSADDLVSARVLRSANQLLFTARA